MLKTVEVEIKKEHQVLMVKKTTSFEKGKGNKGNFKKNGCRSCRGFVMADVLVKGISRGAIATG